MFLLTITYRLVVVFNLCPFLRSFFSFIIYFMGHFPVLIISNFEIRAYVLSSPRVVTKFAFAPFRSANVSFNLQRLNCAILVEYPIRVSNPFGVFVKCNDVVRERFSALILGIASVAIGATRTNEQDRQRYGRRIFELATRPLSAATRLVRRNGVRPSVRLRVHLPFRVLI